MQNSRKTSRWQYILPGLLSIFTGHREKTDIVWYKNNWLGNAFRLYEMLFWRKVGIRAEGASGQNEDGTEWHVSYTYEHLGFRVEHAIREFLARKYRLRFKINLPDIRLPEMLFPMPQLAYAGVGRLPEPKKSPFLFAIAWDADDGFVAYQATLVHIVTGTNPALYVMDDGDGQTTVPSPWTCTYNSVGMTDIRADNQDAPGSDRWKKAWFLGASSTGSNTISTSGSTFNMLGCVSYSGAQSSSTVDSSFSDYSTTTSHTTSTTVVAANCWLVGTFDVVSTASTGTLRGAKKDNFQCIDSNATVGTGSQSLAVNKVNAGKSCGIVASFAPFTAAASSVNLRSLLGVGK